MTIPDQELTDLRQLCPTSTYTSSDPEFSSKSFPWSVWAERHPQLVVEPQELPTIKHVVKYLSIHTAIDLCMRNTGAGDASASEVCLSIQGFKDFHWDPSTETVALGVGWSLAKSIK